MMLARIFSVVLLLLTGTLAQTLDSNGHFAADVSDPILPTHVANKRYVDSSSTASLDSIRVVSFGRFHFKVDISSLPRTADDYLSVRNIQKRGTETLVELDGVTEDILDVNFPFENCDFVVIACSRAAGRCGAERSVSSPLTHGGLYGGFSGQSGQSKPFDFAPSASGGYALETFFYSDALGHADYRITFGFLGETGTNRILVYYQFSVNYIRTYIDGVQKTFLSSSVLPRNTWTHFVLNHPEGEDRLDIYENGVLIGTPCTSGCAKSAETLRFTPGTHDTTGPVIYTSRQLEKQDTLSYFRAFNKGLTASEVADLSAMGVAHDNVIEQLEDSIIAEETYPGSATSFLKNMVLYDEPRCFKA